MNNIKTKEDVLGWAKMIVEAKGEKYSPLSKGDLFAIASMVVELATNEKKEELAEVAKEDSGDHNIPLVDDLVLRTETPDATNDLVHRGDVPPSAPASFPSVDPAPSRFEFFKGKDAQYVFEQFLACSKERAVMDFGTGDRSIGAAFAFWLLGQMSKSDVAKVTKAK